MYYHEVGDSRSSLTRDVCQNEIVSGQDWEYIRQILIHAGEREFDFDPKNYRVLLTGLPKSVYTGVYRLGANDMMRIVVQLEKRLEKLWREEDCICRGEVILHLYGEKQLILLFTAGEGSRNEEACAIRTAETACVFLQEAYETSFLKDGRYRNAAFLSPRMRWKSEIGKTVSTLLSAWDVTFFDEKCRVYLPGEWESCVREEDEAALKESLYQLRLSVLHGNADGAEAACREAFSVLSRTRDYYLLSSALEEQKSEYIGYQSTLNRHERNRDELNRIFDRAGCAGIGELATRLSALWRETAEAVHEMGKPHGLLADRAMRIIADHIADESLGLQFVADRLGITTSYLSSLFKRETGMGFPRYVTEQRLRRAAVTLRETRLPISVIASGCGFTDAKYFSTCFRRMMGTTPQEYRDLF